MNESLYNLKTLRSHGMAENVKITCHIDSVYNSLQMLTTLQRLITMLITN